MEFSNLYDEKHNDLINELESVIIYSEVLNVLQDLKQNFRIFLISNLASPYKKSVFDNNLDHYFEKMIFSCDYGCLKPENDIFKEVEKITKNEPSEILMIGDSFKSDIIGARKMKWNYLKINRNTPITKGYEIKDLSEIRKHIITTKLF
nr:HAD family hydrolase [Flammeovirga aprica]